jgi:nucleotide-binding universal stress UspA family protein
MSSPYRHIACCIAQDEMAADVIREGLRVADGDASAVTLVHVVATPSAADMSPFAYVAPIAEYRGGAEAWLAGLQGAVPGARAQVLDGVPAKEVAEWAGSAGVDLIVAAGRRGFVERALVGGFASHLAYHAPCPVLLIPQRAHREVAGDPIAAAASADVLSASE